MSKLRCPVCMYIVFLLETVRGEEICVPENFIKFCSSPKLPDNHMAHSQTLRMLSLRIPAILAGRGDSKTKAVWKMKNMPSRFGSVSFPSWIPREVSGFSVKPARMRPLLGARLFTFWTLAHKLPPIQNRPCPQKRCRWRWLIWPCIKKKKTQKNSTSNLKFKRICSSNNWENVAQQNEGLWLGMKEPESLVQEAVNPPHPPHS